MKKIIYILLFAMITNIGISDAQNTIIVNGPTPAQQARIEQLEKMLEDLNAEIESLNAQIAQLLEAKKNRQLTEKEQEVLKNASEQVKAKKELFAQVDAVLQKTMAQFIADGVLQMQSEMPSLEQMKLDAMTMTTLAFFEKYEKYLFQLDIKDFRKMSLEEKKIRYRYQEEALLKAREEISKYKEDQTNLLYNLETDISAKIQCNIQLEATTLVPDSQYADVVEQVNTQLKKAGYEPLNAEEKAYIVNSTKEAEAAYDKIEADKWKMQKEEKKLKDVWDIIKVECPECAQQKK